MGFWEDVELLEEGSFNDNLEKFLDYYDNRDLTEDEKTLLEKIRQQNTKKGVEDLIKQLFIFKKKSYGSFIHNQFVSEADFSFGIKELRKTLKLLRQEFLGTHRFKQFSIFGNNKNFISLIKVQNSTKKELVQKFTTNNKIDYTRSIIIEKRGNKLNLFFQSGLFGVSLVNKISNKIKDISNILVPNNVVIKEMKNEFDKIVSFENLESIRFKETNLPQTPRLELNSINTNQSIKEAVDKMKSFLFEDARYILSFKLRLSSLIQIKIKRTLKRIKKGSKDIGIKYKFTDKNLSQGDLEFLTNNNIKNNLIVIGEDSKLDLSSQVSRLFANNGQLFWLDILLCQKALSLLEKEQIAKKKDVFSLEINDRNLENKILEFFKKEGYNSKKITGLYKLNPKATSLYLLKNKFISFYLSIIKKNDKRSIKSILNRCSKLDTTPIFVCLSDTNKLENSEFVQILLGDLIENESSFSVREDVINPYFRRIKERSEKTRREAIENIEMLIEATPENFGNLAEGDTGEILRLFFPSSQKLGGKYIPDGINFIDHEGSISVWDSKYWIDSSFCKNKVEISKLQRYLNSSKMSKVIKEIGKFRRFWIVGKIDDENFKELKKSLKIPLGVILDYLDFNILKRLTELYFRVPNDELYKNNFFTEAQKVILNKDLSLLEELEKNLTEGEIVKEILNESELREEFKKRASKLKP